MRASKNIIRVYPIRMTKSEWKIPLYCYHTCNSRCAQMYVRDRLDPNTIRYILVDNPEYIDEKCPLHNQLQPTSPCIHSFEINRPFGSTGPLYEPNMVVIPDNQFSMMITYPLINTVNVTINSSTSSGFTLAQLISSIKMVYHYIYQEEERTSTPISYQIKKECGGCKNKILKDFVKEIKSPENLECSICYNKYILDDACQLSCNHIYHKQCIFRWLENAKTCPLCRRQIIQCNECDGSGIIYYNYNGVVIPLEHRENILNRNTTNGIFGIYGHDLEDLFIEYLHYNRVTKYLSICMGS